MNAIRFNFQFDVQKMAKELQSISSSFETIYSRSTQDGKLLGIHLINSLMGNGQNSNGQTYQATPELEQCPYLQSVLDTFKCNKFNYRVHNLTSGGKITLHRDSGKSIPDRIVRIHIPVTTNNDIHFHVNGERVQMQNGECWLADISKPHEVENRSSTDRMQLMIDCDLNEWWEKVLEDCGMQIPTTSKWSSMHLEDLQAMKKNLTLLPAAGNSDLAAELASEIEKRKALQA
ncbi:aspartyl/asparaginyl beta-hydroxylase domain-containing protein [Neolewinella persica]|uniref:aspartyl/asparaginyl beta-hydroxylase domain-containing protein n=1 Tax=Neolewinella persica TaxID=70998 RepID=UPI000362E259|nr:aspartyl/asparaginyl beta-hydroxylase domain-containing protein [Neolewinella persica]